jgi:hypothetical protein
MVDGKLGKFSLQELRQVDHPRFLAHVVVHDNNRDAHIDGISGIAPIRKAIVRTDRQVNAVAG